MRSVSASLLLYFWGIPWKSCYSFEADPQNIIGTTGRLGWLRVGLDWAQRFLLTAKPWFSPFSPYQDDCGPAAGMCPPESSALKVVWTWNVRCAPPQPAQRSSWWTIAYFQQIYCIKFCQWYAPWHIVWPGPLAQAQSVVTISYCTRHGRVAWMVAECTWLELVLQVGTLKEVLNDLATIMTRMYQFFCFWWSWCCRWHSGGSPPSQATVTASGPSQLQS